MQIHSFVQHVSNETKPEMSCCLENKTQTCLKLNILFDPCRRLHLIKAQQQRQQLIIKEFYNEIKKKNTHTHNKKLIKKSKLFHATDAATIITYDAIKTLSGDVAVVFAKKSMNEKTDTTNNTNSRLEEIKT